MSILVSDLETSYAVNVQRTEDTLTVDLSDGRTISVPLGWFPRLENAILDRIQLSSEILILFYAGTSLAWIQPEMWIKYKDLYITTLTPG